MSEQINPFDHIIHAVDTSEFIRAYEMVERFADAGGTKIKLGLEAEKALGGIDALADIAERFGVEWVYDGKIKDIATTMERTIQAIVKRLDYPPIGITMHADTSFDGMQRVQEAAGDIKMLGVTLLTDIGPKEALVDYGNDTEQSHADYKSTEGQIKIGEAVRRRVVLQRARKLGRAGVMGLVASPKEVGMLRNDIDTKGMFYMIPGTRSAHASTNDQANVSTPTEAIRDGADLLVIGRQIANSPDPKAEIEHLSDEIRLGLGQRS